MLRDQASSVQQRPGCQHAIRVLPTNEASVQLTADADEHFSTLTILGAAGVFKARPGISTNELWCVGVEQKWHVQRCKLSAVVSQQA
jgi:hypothetical protein